MGLFKRQLANVVEWTKFQDDMIFWKWDNDEIKKGSRLILRPGQDAIFLKNGKIDGVFTDDGDYDIESEILPFLSSLKGIKFGFDSGMRVEVLFVNTREFELKWGTKNPINIQANGFPGGIPIRANGNLYFKIKDDQTIIDKLAGIRESYYVEDLRDRIISVLDQLLMKWIHQEGKDMFNLQASAFDIAKGLKLDLDQEVYNDGMMITKFNIMSFNYPKEVQDMINKNAGQQMIGDMDRYTQTAFADGMAKGGGGSTAGNMAEAMMGMKMAEKMMDSTEKSNNQPSNQSAKKFCSNCGTPASGGKFCSNCGQPL